MRISKSRFMEMRQCKKQGWLSVHRPDLIEVDSQTEEKEREGTEIGELARSIFGKYDMVEISKDKGKMIRDTQTLIENGSKIIAEGSFSYNGCFCSTDLLRVIDKDKKIIELLEVKGTTSVKPDHLVDMAFQYYVLNGCGYNIKAYYHVCINGDYCREGDLDLNALFKLTNCLPDVKLNLPEIEENIEEYKTFLDSQSEPVQKIGCHCHFSSTSDCPYFEHCKSYLPSPNVFDLKGKGITFKQKVQMFEKGIITFEDIIKFNPKMNACRMKEVECAVKKKDLPIDKKSVKDFIGKFKYPINFLDFESYQNPIPEFEYSKPFEQLPFQYSLHILYEDGRIEHKEFIAPVGSDTRLEVGKRLIDDLSANNGTICAYNDAFEKMIIKSLADLFPLKYLTLMGFRSRFIDLMDPFSKQWIYKESFKMKYSIKYVLPALFPDDPELNYKNLDTIQNGNLAMKAYLNIKKLSKEEQEKVFKQLYKYCELDTFALVKIFTLLKDFSLGKAVI